MSEAPTEAPLIERTAKRGDNVRVHYRGTLDNGEVFDSSFEGDALEFRLGTGQIISGFERTVEGMKVGETQTVRLTPKDAYGEKKAELLLELPKSNLPDNASPTVGQMLELQQQDGSSIPVTISAVSEDTITIDANHPLAGQALTFEVQLLDILS